MHSSYTRPNYQARDFRKEKKGYESKFQVSDNNSEFGKDDSLTGSIQDETRKRHKSLKPKEKPPKKSTSMKKIRVGDQARFTNIKLAKKGINEGKGGGSYPELIEEGNNQKLDRLRKQKTTKSDTKAYNESIINKVLKKGIHDRLFNNEKGAKRLSTVFDDKGIPHSEACGPNCRHLQFLNELNSKIPDGMYILKQTQHSFGTNF
uniref:Uncharacterized protein n=1 Tax=Euplotes crassus TaxID=5936 RepID=A0A7S3KA42_EUPCR|mmetsp:Transcript_13656/g.13575  ORF Transcript_13656/g.13575 Transcript_13656/m.13575 type:complete len:205 (+) Transcript_13656:220-834(+)